jgi:isocitrate/isopropylmalate dehydrogenase
MYGDGVGPEIMEATLRVLREAEAMLQIETIEVGQRIYDMESSCGILPSAWEKLFRTKLLLQAPVAEPEGKNTLHATLCYRLGIVDGERHTLTPGCSVDTHFGENFAIFMPAHGTLDEHAGKDTANPASMIFAAIMLLSHIGQDETAGRIWRALVQTLEEEKRLSTTAFADTVIERLWG